jgi:hypothetical protein
VDGYEQVEEKYGNKCERKNKKKTKRKIGKKWKKGEERKTG